MTDINEIIGRAMWEQRRRFAAEQYPDLPPLEEWDTEIPRLNGVMGEADAVVKALGEAGYEITPRPSGARPITGLTTLAEILGHDEEPPAGIKGLSDI